MSSSAGNRLARVTREVAVAKPKAALQEAVIVTAAAVHGVRVALSFDNVDRLRAEVKAETRRARRARKEETKAALAFYRAHHGGEKS